MGDYAQTLTDVDASDAEAPVLKQRLESWLIERGVVAAEVTDCVLGEPGGHPPGDRYGYAIGNESVAAPHYWTNGLIVESGRQVYWGADLEAVTCPKCGHVESMTPREQGRWDTAFDAAISEWLAGGQGFVPCLGCGAENGLNDWDWGYPWAFGALGLTVWNWDELSEGFIAEIRELLDGHRLVYCYYKL
ncbi:MULTISPECIES: hypothetical protein [Mycolicibacterium]|uniref:Uncharacterized protein n=1 Tax=Mycolicibacterium senegalense TaxID=1796 RepID=A0A378SYG6_9MYCO|nr:MULTISPECIES: hypothetical protein [Mycolicibacterium]MCV7338952.1 hypothetical protein [Mycolicibacterium senegalense]MDR7292072.1 hypothetical protein [Mycolicibacterium senegalense]QZA23482.1 hypothetical protein K3U95_22795 [Mycolicibacterium senegalense]CDP89537.1 hypothetical protein BN975_05397 [Mycolicibacterium farcinogenes]STZ52927.1 Uncharacterised protein [Mycolicibacterium senegalense]